MPSYLTPHSTAPGATLEDDRGPGCSAAADRPIGGRVVVVEGAWLKVARIFDEFWIDAQPLEAPEVFIADLDNRGTRADLFTFAQALPETGQKFQYPTEWDNLAVAPTLEFATWWDGLPQETRKNVRRAQRRGLIVRADGFDDELVRGIKGVYDETPIRQGRRFWHYGKDLETIKRENSSYLARSQFLAAYHADELVGFLKMVYVGQSARIMQILAKNYHFDKRPINALLAKAVEICSERRIEQLVYGQYIYGKNAGSQVTEFKRRNGFHQVLLPRYYIPLNLKGRLALAANLHRGLKALLPAPVLSGLQRARQAVYQRTILRSNSPARGQRPDAPASVRGAVSEPLADE